MSSREPFSELRRRLAEAGAPAEYISRLLDELQNDVRESVDAAMRRGQTEAQAHADAMEKIGSQREIAASAVHMLRQESWLGRHQTAGLLLVSFVFFPVWVILIDLILMLCGYEIWQHMHLSRTGVGAHVGKWATELGCNLVVPALSLWGMARVCRRKYCRGSLTTAALALACFWSVVIRLRVQLPPTPDELGAGIFGLYLPWPLMWPYPVLPMLVGAAWLAGRVLVHRGRRGFGEPAQ
jgi:hypothetical protein